MTRKPFIAVNAHEVLQRHGLDSMDALWALQLEAVDAPNTGRGGWSSVHRLELDDANGTSQHFYLKHNVLTAELLVPGHDDLWVVATHAEAYSQDGTKKLHIDQFKDAMDALVEDGMRVVGGGDLNALPPGSDKTVGFADSVCVNEDFQADDYSAETDWLDALYADYQPAVGLADYEANNACHFTHTTTDDGEGGFWNRKLDYLFTNTSFIPGSTVTHQGPNPDPDLATTCVSSSQGIDTMPLSDHAPIETTWEVGP